MNPSSAPGESPTAVGGVVTPAAAAGAGLGEDHQIHQLAGLDQRGQGLQPQGAGGREREKHGEIWRT